MGQSAGNLLPGFLPPYGEGNLYNIQGSSETTRGTIKIDNRFKWRLIGFAEKDGYFGVDKKGYLTFKVT